MDGEIKYTAKKLAEENSILETLPTYGFLVVFRFWNKVMDETFNVSTYLQKSIRDLETVSHLRQIKIIDYMKDTRNEYQSPFKQE